jgi:hypothetical protein
MYRQISNLQSLLYYLYRLPYFVMRQWTRMLKHQKYLTMLWSLLKLTWSYWQIIKWRTVRAVSGYWLENWGSIPSLSMCNQFYRQTSLLSNGNTGVNLAESAAAHTSARRAEAVEAPDYGIRPISPQIFRAWCLINYRDFAATFRAPWQCMTSSRISFPDGGWGVWTTNLAETSNLSGVKRLTNKQHVHIRFPRSLPAFIFKNRILYISTYQSVVRGWQSIS